MVIHTTLCYLIKDSKILLQKKSKELFGGGKWNGPGGKLNENENPQDGAKREILEELCIKVPDFEKYGLLKFFKGSELFIVSHVFVSNEFQGEPKSGREGIVNWFDFKNIPFKEMWPDDKFWMPLMLQGKKFEGDFYFDDSFKEILNYELNVI